MPNPCIIITRPFEDATDTAKLLAKNNIDSFIQPAISIENISGAKAELLGAINAADGIIITSKNALRMLNTFDIPRSTPIISIGEATTSFASRIGFKNTNYAGENITSLQEYIKATNSGKTFIYASGEIITTELSHENCAAYIKRIIVYKTIPTLKLPDNFKNNLKNGKFSGIIFLSNHTAQIFCNLLVEEGLSNHITSLTAFCLSENIAKNIAHYGFNATMHPKNANIDAIIDLVTNFRLHN